MLLFISIRLVSSISAQSVSIHLMLLFISLCRQILLPDSPVSIHLMLLFIEKQRIAGESKGKFQYISCYSLSSVDTARSLVKMKFQYISCYSLSKTSCPKSLTMGVSIHLMLLFIGTLNPWTTGTMVFQYISCYSLSNAESGIHFHAHAFQYISCYSLSARQAEYEHMRFTFQYISCYSLSVIERLQKDGYVRFNTSHVTLYR